MTVIKDCPFSIFRLTVIFINLTEKASYCLSRVGTKLFIEGIKKNIKPQKSGSIHKSTFKFLFHHELCFSFIYQHFVFHVCLPKKQKQKKV